MRHIGVAVSRDKDRRYRVYFDRDDVQKACCMLPCSKHSESCIRMMEKRKTSCELCYAVLTALRKSPVRTRTFK